MLDEPFSGVDPIAVYDVQQIIVNLRKSGLAIMITDHKENSEHRAMLRMITSNRIMMMMMRQQYCP